MVQDFNTLLYRHFSELGVIDQEVLDSILSTANSKEVSLEQELSSQSVLSERNLSQLIADYYQVPAVYLRETAVSQEAVSLLPEEFAKEQWVVCFQTAKSTVSLAMNNPSDEKTIDLVEKKTGKKASIFFATKTDMQDAFQAYSKNVTEALTELIKAYEKSSSSNKASEPPIIAIVDTILHHAYENRASDIHIEPGDEGSLVRFRIDGILHDVITFPTDLHQSLVTRVKILSDLRTDEHQKAQDGRIVFQTSREELDLRVSIVPITKGENIVMRLLSDRNRQSSLDGLGITGTALERLQNAYSKSSGMILVTGPTGSGKTTTLYSVLKLLNKRDINIMTIEDPVEYDIENISQIQVNNKADLTFAKGLRSVVRQDPDIILVGEIRDEETADISINAALTGHLVLSTLHTRDAATTFPRLTDLNVEPYLIASSINVVVAQRLVRRICMSCRVSKEEPVEQLDEKMKPFFLKKQTVRSYLGKGCQVCHQTGYQGRIGIYEVLEVDEEIKSAVLEKRDASMVEALAVERGMVTMLQDGVRKVEQGITTFEEVLRVTGD